MVEGGQNGSKMAQSLIGARQFNPKLSCDVENKGRVRSQRWSKEYWLSFLLSEYDAILMPAFKSWIMFIRIGEEGYQ